MPILTMQLVAAILSAALGVFTAWAMVVRVRRSLLEEVETKAPVYSDHLKELMGILVKASEQVDAVLKDIALAGHQRDARLLALKTQIEEAESREQELKERIEALADVPLPVAEYFTQYLRSERRRDIRRDYALFLAGVGVTTIIGFVLQFVFRPGGPFA